METQTNKIYKANKFLRAGVISLVFGGILAFVAGGYVVGILGTGSFNPKKQIEISQERDKIRQGLMKKINLDGNDEYVTFKERMRFYEIVGRDPCEPSMGIDTFLNNLYEGKDIFEGRNYQEMKSDLEKISQYKQGSKEK